MIRQPNDPRPAKKMRMIIAGNPGYGKTLLALSAPKPLLIDLDKGVDRIEPEWRVPYIQDDTYEEMLEDLTEENLKPFETIVVDTGGKLQSIMTPYLIKQDAKNGQSNGALSLRGFGALGMELQNFLDKLERFNKHVVIVFHATEEKDGDDTKLRIMAQGSFRNTVWQPMDLGGFMEMRNNKRVIGFSPCDKYYAKGTRGISGVYEIPELKHGEKNDFLTRLFEMYAQKDEEDTSKATEELDAYNKAMDEIDLMLSAVVDCDTAAQFDLDSVEHALTSREEGKAKFLARLKEIGVKYDGRKKAYVKREA